MMNKQQSRDTRYSVETLNVAIIDDSPVERWGIKRILMRGYEVEVVCECSEMADALRHVASRECDLVVLGVSRFAERTFQGIRKIREHSPKTAVLVISPSSDDQFALCALQSGASGYITKDSPVDEVEQAVNQVMGGGRYVPMSLTDALYLALQHDDASLMPHERLSERESQVMIGLASGKSIREISTELELSIKTVNTYKYRMYDKMNLRYPSQLVRYATWNNLMDLKCA